jgi:hypothetical protein
LREQGLRERELRVVVLPPFRAGVVSADESSASSFSESEQRVVVLPPFRAGVVSADKSSASSFSESEYSGSASETDDIIDV